MDQLRALFAPLPLAVRVLSVAAGALGLLTLLLLFIAGQALDQQAAGQAEARAQQLNGLLRQLAEQHGPPASTGGQLSFGDWVASDAALAEPLRRLGDVDAAVYQVVEGRLVLVPSSAASAASARGLVSEPPAPVAQAALRGEGYQGRLGLSGREYLIRAEPIRSEGGSILGLYVAGVPLAAGGSAAPVLLAMGVVAAAVSLAGLFLLLLAVQPLQRAVAALSTVANGLAAGTVERPRGLPTDQSLGPLAQAVDRLADYLQGTAESARRMADGDLQQAIQPRSERDALGHALARLQASLRKMVSDIQQQSAALAATAQHLGVTASQTTQAVYQVAGAVNDVAEGAEAQSFSVQDTHRSLQQLLQVIGQVADSAQAVAVTSQKARMAAERGAGAVRDTSAGMATLQGMVTQAVERVGALGAHGERMERVVETIDYIAEETNLLAVNAAITAAMAGDQGLGFAVVADEVRKLAERSQQETRAIGDMIREVQDGTREAVSAIGAGAQQADDGARQAAQASEAIEQILAAVAQSATQVDAIAQAAQEMTVRSLRVSAATANIATVIEQNANGIGGVSAATEQMAAQVEAMAARADELAATASSLQALVAHFHLDADRRTNGTAMRLPALARA